MSILLALIAVLSALSACNEGTDDTNTTQAETQPVQRGTVILEKGVPQFVIVRPENKATDSATVVAAVAIKTELKKYLAAAQSVSITGDWLKEGETHDPEAWEILVGDTNYAETDAVKGEIAENGWAIRLSGKKIVIYAKNDECITRAAATFTALLSKNAKQDENGLYDVVLAEGTLPISGTVTRDALDVPQPEGYTDVSFYKANLEGDEAIYTGATREMYDAYLQKLKASGFDVFSETEIAGNPFATVYNGVHTINTGFYANEKTIRTIVETYNENGLFAAEADNNYTAVTTTTIGEIGVAYYDSSTGKNMNTGECVIIRLADGRFIVFDGGHAQNGEMSNIIKYLRLQAKDYMGQNDNTITIAAWFFTHPHGDHWAAFVKSYSQLASSKINVQNIVYNFLSEEELTKFVSKYNNTYTNGGNNGTLPQIAKSLNANIINCHVGNTYYIANMKMEVLYTIESYCQLPNDLNALSPVLKMSFYDPETGELMNTFMHVGDCTGYGLRCAANTFQDYLLTDIGQVPHHGASTKGDDAGNILFFKYNQAATFLWTAGTGCEGYKNYSYLSCAVTKAKNKNFKEYLFSANIGRAVILELPYTPGHAYVNNNYLK